MRPRICPNRRRVKRLSASCRMKYRACRIRRPPGLEQALLESRQESALDGDRQGEPAQRIAEVVGVIRLRVVVKIK
jgi:hypothetical protein